MPTDTGKFKIKVMNINKQLYSTNYARLKPFLLAYGRSKMLKTILDMKLNIDNIYRIHTDCIFYTEPIKNDKYIKNELGCLKLLKQGKCTITHVNKYKFTE